ncbi:TIGR04500 family putative peptide maturation system protein [Streptosporangium sp. NBC_01755]|uniref:TIGR04500 family putative peptide maturation system protein n=1 Tax=unclassified Streptosporangium TaxID=2632669 RepID=UPI002DDB5C28|nr:MULTISPECIES: TIGR04500 family putative peptide maturation system protein [unclassified Streptosporangium]WSA27236.1 TIGR04500 family putative peptide maturation system protein [Streptosporangium sp. NBC_01810]WSD01211.1 TIGR04500 family putative peptide maturation system protein [Streptosporangium sp. NBC_01755]
MSDLGTTLASGVRLLRGLPRRRAQVPQARRTAAAWAADHPGLKAELVVDERPGTSVVDFDLLFQDPEGGTIALTAQADDGVPWLIDHSTHWAAGQLVSVDGIHLSVAQALTMIRSLSRRDATPHDEIVDQCLVLDEIQHDDTPVGDEDLQAASEEFRRGRGLHDRATTLAWLAEVGMTLQQFDGYIGGIARRRNFRRRREAELGPAYLAAHAGKFDRVRALWSIGPERVLADLAGDSPDGLLPALAGPAGEVETTIAERFAFELPEPLRDAEPGDVVGPTAHGTAFLAGVVLGRTASSADERTLAAAGRVAFTEWLAERRAAASIEWHWP